MMLALKKWGGNATHTFDHPSLPPLGRKQRQAKQHIKQEDVLKTAYQQIPPLHSKKGKANAQL